MATLDEQLEVMRSARAQAYATEQLAILNDIDSPRNWQPSDLLPDVSKENDTLRRFRDQASGLTPAVAVVLIGDMITEEALPTYMSQLNRTPGLGDETGTSDTPMAKWVRGWTAEENRHGDALNGLLRLNPNVDMRSVESTVQHLIAEGFDPRTDNLPYQTVYYTTFQEWATMLSHQRVAELARADGDEGTNVICRRISGDEGRHQRFYKGLFSVVAAEDPDGALLAMAEMVEKGIVMPAEKMTENSKTQVKPTLFDRFARVAGRLGVYSHVDYWEHVRDLVEDFHIGNFSVSGEAARAQEYLATAYKDNIEKAVRLKKILEASKPQPFPWIKGAYA